MILLYYIWGHSLFLATSHRPLDTILRPHYYYPAPKWLHIPATPAVRSGTHLISHLRFLFTMAMTFCCPYIYEIKIWHKIYVHGVNLVGCSINLEENLWHIGFLLVIGQPKAIPHWLRSTCIKPNTIQNWEKGYNFLHCHKAICIVLWTKSWIIDTYILVAPRFKWEMCD